MKIRDTLGKSTNLTGILVKEERKVTEGQRSFRSQLTLAESHNYEDRVQEMVLQISRQGEKLAKRADIAEFKQYKRLISEFMNEVVGNSHKFSKKNFLDRRGRHRVYAIVKKVDEELELLTQEVLSSQNDNIGIQKKLDDIRGLLLDLAM